MKTVNRNFQMNIERYVVVNIHGLADISEALGGVDMELTKGEAQAINYELHVKEPMDDVQRDKLEVADGVQHLDGMEAVTYGRIRNLQGQNDLNRNERQRKLLEALLKKVMEDMDLTKFLNLIETALPYGKTNLTADELLSLGMTVLSGSAMQNLASGGEVVGQFGIPMEKQYGYREFNGESLVYISDKRMQTTLTAMQGIHLRSELCQISRKKTGMPRPRPDGAPGTFLQKEQMMRCNHRAIRRQAPPDAPRPRFGPPFPTRCPF